MRHPRLTPVPLVAVAHGSPDARAAATIGDLLARVAERAAARGLDGLDVRQAFLDHGEPSLPGALAALAPGRGACVVLPLLLTAAYHSKIDIPAQIAAADGTARLDIRYAAPLGPHPSLLAALERRLAQAGADLSPRARARTSVVLAAAGSSDASANAINAALAAGWQRDAGWRRVVPGYASAAGPSPAEAVMALRAAATDGTAGPPGPVIVATYLLAPGYFADRVRTSALAAGATVVSGVLGAADEVADVVLARYEAALRDSPGLASDASRA